MKILSVIGAIIFIDIIIVSILLRNYMLQNKSKRGKLIVIDGIDGSGKQTQTELLYNKLVDKGYKVKKLSFPNYDSTSSVQVREYLHGKYRLTNSIQKALLYTVDRIVTFGRIDEENSTIFDYMDDGYIILCDRYTTSNFIHHENENIKKKKRFIRLIKYIEFTLCKLPEPDMVLFLEVHPNVSMNNISKRNDNTSNDTKDIHENLEHLMTSYRQRDNVINICKWTKIKCSDSENMFDINSISDNINKQVICHLEEGVRNGNINFNDEYISRIYDIHTLSSKE